MSRFFPILALLLVPSLALAQGCGPTNPNCIVPTAPAGTSNNQAASTAFVANATRTKLTAATTLFADFVNGSDSNNNCTSASTPCKTVQKAYNQLVLNFDTAGQTVTISFNNNDTLGLIIATAWTGGGQVTVQGPGGSPPSIGLVPVTGGTNAVLISTPLPAALNLVGFKLSGPDSGIRIVAPGVKVTVNNLNFAASGIGHIVSAVAGALVQCSGAYTVSGGAQAHWYAVIGGNIFCQVPITLTGTPAFSIGFATAQTLALIFAGGSSFTGSATGPRYNVIDNSIVNTATGNVNFLPGNAAGFAGTGGIYE